MPVKVLIDEHISPEVAHQLAALGFDVVCVRDRGLLSRKDWELMPWCIGQQRAICTQNGPHFEREHRRCRDRQVDHFGVLVVGRYWTPAETYWSLRQYLESDPGPMLLNQVVFLEPATPEFIQERSPE